MFKKKIVFFLLLAMVFAIFATATAFAGVLAVQSRDGPLITAPVAETNAAQLSVIAISNNVIPVEVWGVQATPWTSERLIQLTTETTMIDSLTATNGYYLRV